MPGGRGCVVKHQAFAAGTTVSPEKTRAEIETLLMRYGAKGFRYTVGEKGASIEFLAHERLVRFRLVYPDPSEKRFRIRAGGWQSRTPAQQLAAWEAEIRLLWRSLFLAIKAKLELVRSGITVFEEEFLAHVVMPDGMTFGQHITPRIAEAYASGSVRALLPEFTS